jgi:hypothetical protein
MSRWLSWAVAVSLLLGIVWLLRADDATRGGAALRPARLTVRVGDRAEVSLVVYERRVAAFGFRLRFDERVVAIDAADPVQKSIVEGGNSVVVPPRRGPGLLEVPGVALTGGRAFVPSDAVYRLTVRAVAPGTTGLTVEGLTLVNADSHEPRTVNVAAAELVVRP